MTRFANCDNEFVNLPTFRHRWREDLSLLCPWKLSNEQNPVKNEDTELSAARRSEEYARTRIFVRPQSTVLPQEFTNPRVRIIHSRSNCHSSSDCKQSQSPKVNMRFVFANKRNERERKKLGHPTKYFTPIIKEYKKGNRQNQGCVPRKQLA